MREAGDGCPRLRRIALEVCEPLPRQRAVLLFEFDAEIPPPCDQCRDERAPRASEGIKENLSSLKFFGSRTASEK
jgi:hypothetical protein